MGKARTPQQKEEAQKRRNMQKEIYERLDEEARKEFIETRKGESQKKIQERKGKVAFFNECVRRGMEYARKNRRDILFFDGNVGVYGVSASAILKTGEKNEVYYQIAYTLRKPSDFYSLRIARGISAFRIMDGIKNKYQFRLGLTKPGGVNPKRMRAIIEAHIQMDALSARVPIPSLIGREIVRDHKHVELKDPPDKNDKKTKLLMGKEETA